MSRLFFDLGLPQLLAIEEFDKELWLHTGTMGKLDDYIDAIQSAVKTLIPKDPRSANLNQKILEWRTKSGRSCEVVVGT